MTDYLKAVVEEISDHACNAVDQGDVEAVAVAFLAHLDATGWQIVPKVATVEMLEDGHFAASHVRLSGVCGQTVEAVAQHQCARERAAYTAMLAAAPKWGG